MVIFEAEEFDLMQLFAFKNVYIVCSFLNFRLICGYTLRESQKKLKYCQFCKFSCLIYSKPTILSCLQAKG